MTATCSSICSWRSAGVAVKVSSWSSARLNCAIPSTSAERSNDCRPALAQKAADFSIRAGLGVMTRNQLRLARSDFRKLGFQDFRNAGVQPTSALAKKSAVGRILHQGMFEQVSRVRRYALPKQQPGPYQTVKSRLQRSFLLARHRSQQGMRELSPNHRSDLRNLLCRTKPIKPRHQRGVEACGNGQRRRRNRRNRPLGVVRTARLKYRLGHFLDEQWNAIGALHDVLPDTARAAAYCR